MRTRIGCPITVLLENQPFTRRRVHGQGDIAGQLEFGLVGISFVAGNGGAVIQSRVRHRADVPAFKLLVGIYHGIIPVYGVVACGDVHLFQVGVSMQNNARGILICSNERFEVRGVVIDNSAVGDAVVEHRCNFRAYLLNGVLICVFGIVRSLNPSVESYLLRQLTGTWIVEHLLVTGRMIGWIQSISLLNPNGDDLVVVLVEVNLDTRLITSCDNHINRELIARERHRVGSCLLLGHNRGSTGIVDVHDSRLFGGENHQRAQRHVDRLEGLDLLAFGVLERDVDGRNILDDLTLFEGSLYSADNLIVGHGGHFHLGALGERALGGDDASGHAIGRAQEGLRGQIGVGLVGIGVGSVVGLVSVGFIGVVGFLGQTGNSVRLDFAGGEHLLGGSGRSGGGDLLDRIVVVDAVDGELGAFEVGAVELDGDVSLGLDGLTVGVGQLEAQGLDLLGRLAAGGFDLLGQLLVGERHRADSQLCALGQRTFGSVDRNGDAVEAGFEGDSRVGGLVGVVSFVVGVSVSIFAFALFVGRVGCLA